MKFRIHFLAPFALALVVFGSACAPPKAHAAVYDDNLYYDQLDPYGDWYFVADYGWCWSPGYVSAGWRPYTVGHWVYSDWGWVWVSEDPWGSWPYHYGRWAHEASYGWIWVPGDVWAPAWVSWRYGSGWVGWAPLPPDVGWTVGIGIQFSSSSLDRRIVSSGWCFVPVRDFADRRIRRRVVPVRRNVTLIQETRNVTRYVDVGSRPVERGLRADLIERATGKRIPRYDITERSVRGRGGVQVRGRSIQVSKPARNVVRAANSKLRSLPRERAERTPDRARVNVNASRQRREREAEVRAQRSMEQRERRVQERRGLQERSRRVQEQRSQQVQERRSQQIQERRSQERRSPQVREQRSRQGQERRSPQVREQRSRQGQERRSQQVREQRSRQGQERRSRQTQEQQRRKQEQDRERQERDQGQGRGRGGGGT